VRTDFAEKYPGRRYIKAILEANAWVRAKTASEMIAKWTGIDKEVVYIFMGPGGIMTMDPTIKPELVQDAAEDAKVLQNLGRMKEFDVQKWVNDSYIRKTYAELGLDYEKQRASFDNYEVKGEDKFCNKPISEPRKSGEIWSTAKASAVQQRGLHARRSAEISARQEDQHGLCLRHARHQAVRGPGVHGRRHQSDITPSLLKKDAEAHAAKTGGKVVISRCAEVGDERADAWSMSPQGRRRGADRISPVAAQIAPPEVRRSRVRHNSSRWRVLARAQPRQAAGARARRPGAPAPSRRLAPADQVSRQHLRPVSQRAVASRCSSGRCGRSTIRDSRTWC
jgi:hypothetical protein